MDPTYNTTYSGNVPPEAAAAAASGIFAIFAAFAVFFLIIVIAYYELI